MDAKLKDLWLKALRSGEYAQADGMLKSGDGYCCLGVLCHVAKEAGVAPDGMISEGGDYMVCRWYDDEDSAPRSSKADIPPGTFGLDDGVIAGAIDRNDGRGPFNIHSFPEIADWLETAVPTDEPKA